MKILAVDTATEACSAGLLVDGEINDRFELAPRLHTKLLLPMVDSLLSEQGLTVADLDALAFGRGPGSFTGVRIATGVVQGLAFAADLPVAPISTLASIAQLVYESRPESSQPFKVLAALDARMGGIYWGCYEVDGQGLMRLSGDEKVSPADDITLPSGEWVMAGSACQPYAETLQAAGLDITEVLADVLPHARSMLTLAADAVKQGILVSADQAMPVYLRNDVAKKAKSAV